MRSSVLCVVFFLAAEFPLAGSSKKLKDAEVDGFTGLIKSVSTKTETVNPSSLQPGSAAVFPASCQICEYDQDGNRVRQGQTSETGFVGETTRYLRDESGSVREQIEQNEKGEIVRRLVIGPAGKTEEEEFYLHGALQSRNTYRYDQSGNAIALITYDADDVETASTTSSYDENGIVTEQFDRGPNYSFRLHFTQIYDPETDVQTLTNYNEDGTVRLAFSGGSNGLTTFWQQPSDTPGYGSSLCFTPAPKQQVCESHNADGTVLRTLSSFADEKRLNPSHVELRDVTGQVQSATDYEYEFDERGNWTKRSVWTSTQEPAQRKLVESDSRILTYWK